MSLRWLCKICLFDLTDNSEFARPYHVYNCGVRVKNKYLRDTTIVCLFVSIKLMKHWKIANIKQQFDVWGKTLIRFGRRKAKNLALCLTVTMFSQVLCRMKVQCRDEPDKIALKSFKRFYSIECIVLIQRNRIYQLGYLI